MDWPLSLRLALLALVGLIDIQVVRDLADGHDDCSLPVPVDASDC